MAIELRASPNTVLNIRTNGDTRDDYIDGYAAVFNQPTIIWDFEEIIAPGAFKRALQENQDVRTLFNHDPNFPLARTKNGSLILREDATGLWTESRVSKNPMADSVVDHIRTGLVSGMSFAFTVRKNEWIFQEPGSDQMDKRIITEVGVLYDVGPVTYPAYEQTSAKIRSDAKKLHTEARTRWESRKVSVQVPLHSDVLVRECRGSAPDNEEFWITEEVVIDGNIITEEEKTQEKDVSNEPKTAEEDPKETPQEEQHQEGDVSQDSDKGQTDPSQGGGDSQQPEIEANSREIEIKRAIARMSMATRKVIKK